MKTITTQGKFLFGEADVILEKELKEVEEV